MGLLENYIAYKKQQSKTYNIGNIYYAYTEDGSICKPFVYNQNNTKVKDLETEKTDTALYTLYSTFSTINQETVIEMIKKYTTGSDIPGDKFKEICKELELSPRYYRSHALQTSKNINNLQLSYEDLKPLTKRLQQTIATQFKNLKESEEKYNTAENNRDF